jgi:RNA-directed DNA polymerase
LHDAPKEVCLGKDLMEAVLSPANLKQAWRRVKSNRGAPGIDGLRIEDFPAYACEHWPAIRQTLSEGRYQPQAVRRVTTRLGGYCQAPCLATCSLMLLTSSSSM